MYDIVATYKSILKEVTCMFSYIHYIKILEEILTLPWYYFSILHLNDNHFNKYLMFIMKIKQN